MWWWNEKWALRVRELFLSSIRGAGWEFISHWFKPLSWMSSTGLPTLRIHYRMKLKQKHQPRAVSPSTITHATLDEKVTSPFVSVGTHACFVSSCCPGLLRKSQLRISQLESTCYLLSISIFLLQRTLSFRLFPPSLFICFVLVC